MSYSIQRLHCVTGCDFGISPAGRTPFLLEVFYTTCKCVLIARCIHRQHWPARALAGVLTHQLNVQSQGTKVIHSTTGIDSSHKSCNENRLACSFFLSRYKYEATWCFYKIQFVFQKVNQLNEHLFERQLRIGSIGFFKWFGRRIQQ